MAVALTRKTGNARVAPGPRGNILFGNFGEARRNLLGFYTRAHREYGDIIRFRGLPTMEWHLALHPDHVEYVLHRNQQNYRKGKVFNGPISLVTGNELLTSEGEFWQRQRRLAQPAFHRQNLVHLASMMVATTEHFFSRWDQLARTGDAFDVVPEMARLTLNIAGLTLFSTDIDAEADAFGTALREAFEFVGLRMLPFAPVPLWIPTPRNRRFLAAKRNLDAVVYRIIQERRRSGDGDGDLLSMLMNARDEEIGEGMSDEQLRDEAITLLLAGHETTAQTLSWAWYALTQHQDVETRLHEEILRVLNGRTPTIDDLRSLPYVKMVLEETMRLYPPAWGLPREAVHEDEIGGYRIRARTLVAVNQYLTHRHPDFWETPERFDPERFTPERVAQRPTFAYFPFGGGRRICIGANFAMMEATLILATLIQRYRPSLVPNHPIELDATFTLRPKHGVMLRIAHRTRN